MRNPLLVPDLRELIQAGETAAAEKTYRASLKNLELALAQNPDDLGRQSLLALTHERLAATVACKAAIKAGDVLSPLEMRALYLALGRTTLPAHDVHGRSTIVRLGWDELERRFGRR